MGSESVVFAIPFVWIAAWIFGSILYRRNSGKPIFPRVPADAVFAETWTSGRSLKNAWTRLGGAQNCLLVYVADRTLTIIPAFPFTLMFLPEFAGLEVTAPISSISVEPVDRWFGKRLRLSVGSIENQQFELALRDPCLLYTSDAADE